VHDENAGRLGGVSGHAGLFSNAPDLARFASWLLEIRAAAPAERAGASERGGSVTPTPPPALVREFTTRQGVPPGSTRALGWDTPSDSGYSSAGTAMSRGAFGHTGFTGTSIWIDPERDLFVILLTNRVNPTRANTRIFRVRVAWRIWPPQPCSGTVSGAQIAVSSQTPNEEGAIGRHVGCRGELPGPCPGVRAAWALVGLPPGRRPELTGGAGTRA
jgi:CubicO group peptidase (beta-lactamase class C family)